MCVLYGPWIQWLFVANAALMGGHYRTNIISGVGHPRYDSVVPLVLCMVVCNGWGIGIVLQVPRDSANPAKMGNISGRPTITIILYHMHILYIYITHNINCHDGTVICFAKTLEYIVKLAWALFVLKIAKS
jgi:hypothetical protein